MSMAVLSIGFGKGTAHVTHRQVAKRYLACLREMAIVEQDPTVHEVQYHLQCLNAEREELEDQLTNRQKARIGAAYSRWYYRYLA